MKILQHILISVAIYYEYKDQMKFNNLEETDFQPLCQSIIYSFIIPFSYTDEDEEYMNSICIFITNDLHLEDQKDAQQIVENIKSIF